jgi:prepilin-type N-terminal cleavage/methylation domain-containing protein
MSQLTNKNSRGFTILELLIAMAIFLTLSGAILGAMATLQANYRTAEIRTTMDQRLRATMELMAQEIGQAGLQASTVDANSIDITASAPFKITSAVIATGQQQVTMSTTSGVYPYLGEWLQVPAGTQTGGSPCTQQDAIQVLAITGSTVTANFGCLHPINTPVYPMGVFPHGIYAGSAGDPSTYANLAIYGEFNGPGNGLYAVEYTCPTTTPGSLMRKEWNLANIAGTGTAYSLIDNVTCYFCWPGTTNTYASCPTGTATPDSVTLPTPSGNVTYSMITQIGFTITASETSTISGSNQTVSVTKSYSNIQPRNIIAADKIYKVAVTSAANAVPPGSYTTYLTGELQPDPPNTLSTIPW